jgi:opacity protein-like surface antigen
MKTFSGTRRALVTLAGTALAATLGPISAHAQESGHWSGFYAGVQGGAARGRLSVQATDTLTQYTNINPPGAQPLTVVPGMLLPLSGRDSRTSVTYGGLVGWQFQSGPAVFGIEADLRAGRSSVEVQTSDQISNTALAPASTVTRDRSARSRYEWSARARIGYAPGNTMFYGTAGVAGAHVRVRGDSAYTIPAGNAGVPTTQPFPAQGPFLVTASETRSLIGWTAGLGIEQRLGAHLRIGLEGRYTDYGSKTFALDNPAQTDAGAAAAAPFTAVSGEGAYPGPTRVGLRDAQVNVRLTFAF